MTTKTVIGTLAALVFATVTIAGSVQASQKSKNDWRNIGIGAAALGGIGLLTHNGTATLLGAGGAAYAAHRYEQDRHNQSVERQRYHRSSDYKYYWYQGHEYRQNTITGDRFFVR